MSNKPCTEATYLKDWKQEIEAGVKAGKLTLQSGRADIKTASAPTDSPDYRQEADNASS